MEGFLVGAFACDCAVTKCQSLNLNSSHLEVEVFHLLSMPLMDVNCLNDKNTYI